MPSKKSSTKSFAYCWTPVNRHERFYLDGGDVVFQVNDTQFKVHRYFLAKASPVLRDMLELPQPERESKSDSASLKTGAEESPLFKLVDSVAGWADILALFYRDDLFDPIEYTPVQWAGILPIANKYAMTAIEEKGLQVLNRSTVGLKPVEILLLAKKINATALYDRAMQMLAEGPMLTGEEAREIEFEEFYKVMVMKHGRSNQFAYYNNYGLSRDERDLHW